MPHSLRTFLTFLRAALLGLVTMAFLGSCGGGGGHSEAPPPLNPPANFTATQGDVFDKVDFQWTPATGGITSYEAEGRLGSGAWASLGIAIPPNAIGGYILFDPTTPELSQFAFHIRSVRGSERSAWSPDATYFRSLRPADSFQAVLDASQEKVQLSWTRASSANTGTRLERTLLDTYGNPGPYAPVADLPADATAYLDEDPAETASYQYRLCHTAGTVMGMQTTVTSPPTILRLPTDFQTYSGVGSVRLEWTNRSTATTAIAVLRVDGGVAPIPPPLGIAILPADATSYSDGGLGTGTYRYSLEFRCPTQTRQTAALTGFSLPFAGWTATQISLPSHVRQQGRDGRWYGWENGYGTGETTIYLSSGDGWEAHTFPLGTWSLIDPGVWVDAQDHPHVAYAWRDPSLLSGPMDLRHAWHDGTTWREETAATRILNFSPGRAPIFGVADDGTPHLFWSSYDLSDQPILEYGVKENGTWTLMTISSAEWSTLSAIGLTAFRVSGDGTAFLALGLPSNHVSTGRLLLLRRPSGGSWSEEFVPAPGVQAGMGDPMVLLPSSSTQIDLLFNVWEWGETVAPWHITRLRKTGSWWDGPQVVYQLPVSGSQLQLFGTADSQGSRMVVIQWPNILHLLGPAQGGWQALTFPASYGFGPIWFDVTGHLHVLTQLSYEISDPMPYGHFSDAP